jgi:hypothetical protein
MSRALLALVFLIGCTSSEACMCCGHLVPSDGRSCGSGVCDPLCNRVFSQDACAGPATDIGLPCFPVDRRGCCNFDAPQPSMTCGFCPSGTIHARACALDCDGDGGPPAEDWRACTRTSECGLAPAACCAECSTPQLEDVDAVNGHRVDERLRDVCPAATPCPPCASSINPELVATCRAGACDEIDVGREAFTTCTTDSDCVLRARSCCECGSLDATNVVAINFAESYAYRELVCDRDADPCTCEPRPPSAAVAVCGADHHCEARQAM